MMKMKIKSKTSDKVYEYDYTCILFKEDAAEAFKKQAREAKLTNSQYLVKLLKGGK